MPTKVIDGGKFVKALEDAGLLPPRTLAVTIEARVGKVPTVTYEVVGDEQLLDIVGGIDDSKPSVAK